MTLPKCHHQVTCCIRKSLLMLAGGAVDAAGAVGGGTAPDALVGAGAVAVLARGGVDAPRTIA